MKIQKTTNYEQFKKISSNRDINQAHLKMLKNSIAEHDMLQQNPIIVSKTMRVIDGQHRLQAARELGLPIYYTIIEQATIDDVQRLNANLRSWTVYDYLHLYVEQGLPAYEQLAEFVRIHKLSISISLRLLAGSKVKERASATKRGGLLREFKEGNFRVTSYESAKHMAACLGELKPYTDDGVWKQRDFISALEEVYEVVDHDQLMGKVIQMDDKLHRQPSVKDYLRAFEDVLNYKAREEIRLY